ncbi:MAG: polyprenyltransferase [Bacteroidetes bacterium]|nr:MAG: polyprenyltransferase [Bacteroidota bacterium]
MSNFRAYLSLMRPPNLLTALADILAGFAAAAALQHTVGNEVFGFIRHDLPWVNLGLIGIASMCLYAGGVVLNDFFDADLDQLERPERPIPTGQVSRFRAALMGGILLILGVVLAFLSDPISGWIALGVGVLVLLYDAITKKNNFLGPLNMGLCRGGNLLLGISIFPQQVVTIGFLVIIPIIYISAITLVSRGEVHGGRKASFNIALVMYLLTVAMVLSLGVLNEFEVLNSLIYLAFLLLIVLPPLFRARRTNDPSMIGVAVKYGVLGLIILNAAVASGFAGWFFGLLLLILLPFSTLLAKLFAVT